MGEPLPGAIPQSHQNTLPNRIFGLMCLTPPISRITRIFGTKFRGNHVALTLTDKHGIKAEICRRYGSLAAFERAHSFPEKSVSDVLRGSSSARIERAIMDTINSPARSATEKSGNMTTAAKCGAAV